MRTQVGIYTAVLAGLSRADLRVCRGWGYVIAVETNTIALDNSGVTRRLGPTETNGPFRSSTLACGLAVGRARAGMSTARVMRTFMHRHCCGLRCCRSAFGERHKHRADERAVLVARIGLLFSSVAGLGPPGTSIRSTRSEMRVSQ